jgi:hypothetical protein
MEVMSERTDTLPNPKAPRSDAGDRRALEQVEKWMAMIRELSREQAKS